MWVIIILVLLILLVDAIRHPQPYKRKGPPLEIRNLNKRGLGMLDKMRRRR